MTLAQLHALLMSVASGPAALDLSTLARLVADLGDAELVADTVQTYLDGTPGSGTDAGAGVWRRRRDRRQGSCPRPQVDVSHAQAARMAELCQRWSQPAGSMAPPEVATELDAAAIQREAEQVQRRHDRLPGGLVT